MALEIVASNTDITLTTKGPVNLLKAVLKAELAPNLTVEEACHTEMHYDVEIAPPFEVLREHRILFHRAGLSYSVGDAELPDAIVLDDPKKFKSAFPHLEAAIPLLIEGQGVRPYTEGLPRVVKRPSLVTIK